MAYSLFETPNGQFSIDTAIVYRIVHAHHRARLQYELSREIRESQTPWYLPSLLGGMPDLCYVTVDWSKVGEASGSAFQEAAVMLYQTPLIVDRLVERLVFAQHETRRYNEMYHRKVALASAKAFGEIERSVAFFESAAGTARTIRDLAGSVLIGIASVPVNVAVGVGALVTAGLGGTALKTVAKYQDTGNIGVAAVEATATIVTSVLPAVPAIKPFMGRLALSQAKVIISASSDTTQALIKGDTPGVALALGATNFVTGTAGDMIKKRLDPLTKSVAVPITIKVAKDMTKKGAQTKVRRLLTDRSPEAPQAEPGGFAANATISDSWLLKWAVVDMAKGIGRSWW